MNIIKHNSTAWDNYVDKKDRWTIPVNKEVLEEAKKGNWQVVLTPKIPVPHHWFPKLKDLKILGLASTIDTLDFDKMTEVVNSTYQVIIKL